MNRFIQKYGKALASVAVACVIAAWQAWSGDRHIDGREATVIVLAFANAGVVYLVPLLPDKPWLKTAFGAVIAGATALSAVILGGLSYDELAVVAFAVLQALGIKFAPAASDNGVAVPAGFSDERVG